MVELKNLKPLMANLFLLMDSDLLFSGLSCQHKTDNQYEQPILSTENTVSNSESVSSVFMRMKNT